MSVTVFARRVCGNITYLELIPFFFRLLFTYLNLLYQAAFYPFSEKTHSIGRTLWRKYINSVGPYSTPRQLQWLLQNVDTSYNKFIRNSRNDLYPESEDIGEGARLHWIGSRSTKRVMLFFHGGAYVLPASTGHYQMVNYWRTKESERGVDLSIAFLEYSLLPDDPWPHQLRQVVAALTHLLDSGKSPRDLILVGDSAGGHLVSCILSHLLHPHPAAPPITNLTEPLAGAALISGWFFFSEDTASSVANAETDLLPVWTLKKWGDMLKESRRMTGMLSDRNWFEPRCAPVEWWSGLSAVVSDVLLTAGGSECMLDDIVETGRKMAKASDGMMSIETFVQEGALHDEILIEFSSGDEHGETTEKMTDWIAKVFANETLVDV